MNKLLDCCKNIRTFLVACAFFMAQILFVVGVFLVGSQMVLAIDDYPHKGEPWRILQDNGTYVYPTDGLGFFKGECTSFVAHRLNAQWPILSYRNNAFTNEWGTGITGLKKWDSATEWGKYARDIGYAVDNKPATYEAGHEPIVGAVAHWSGHVAMVTAVDTKGTASYYDDTVTVEEYNYGNDHIYTTPNRTGIQALEYIHLERPLPGGWWSKSTPENYTSITRGEKTIIYVHAEDNKNGGLQTIKITAKEYRNGSETGDPWRAVKEVTYVTPNKASDDVSAEYTAPVDLDYVLISFDVYSYDRETDALSFQKAPNGGRELYASEFKQERLAQGKTVPFVSIASPLYYDPNYTIGVSIGESPVGQPPSTCTPGSNQVAVFTEKDYQGNCVVKDLGEYLSPEAIGLPNDSISSIKVGGGANVRLCENSGLNSPCEYFPADDPDFSNNGTVHDNTVSSMKVESGAPTTGCVPGDTQVAFFVDPNYSGTCIVKGVGRYDDPNAINLPNDSISSIKVGAKVKARVCNNAGMNSPCEYFDYDDPDLSNNSIGNNTISSAEVEIRGGIALCDGTNYGGNCKWFGVGKYNMQDYGFNDIAESVQYDANWANLYHLVLWTEANQIGNPYHADNNVADLGSAHRNQVSSIEIYKHQPLNATTVTPADGAILSSTATSANLTATGADSIRMHIWGSDYNFESVWSPSNTVQATSLAPGKYFWQVQGQNAVGMGQWSSIASFTINTPPVVWGGNLTVDSGASQTIQVQASDVDGNPLTLSASNLPVFATFTDNHNGIATLSLSPQAANAGQFAITVTVSDGDAMGSGIINVTVVAPIIPLPTAPSNLIATPISSSGIYLTWNDNSDNETGFEISSDNISVEIGGHITSFKWGGLTPGQYMCFRVRAYNDAGHSEFTPYACSTTPTVSSPPLAPTNLTLTSMGSTTIFLRWNDNSNDETGFEISNGVTSVKVGAGMPIYTWSGLTAGQKMCFAVRAYNSAGSSDYTPYVCNIVSTPSAPTGLRATAMSGTKIFLTWNDNSNNETGFEISNGITSVKVGAGMPMYTWSGLTPGQYMCFTVSAYNSLGKSAPTPNSCITTLKY